MCGIEKLLGKDSGGDKNCESGICHEFQELCSKKWEPGVHFYPPELYEMCKIEDGFLISLLKVYEAKDIDRFISSRLEPCFVECLWDGQPSAR